MTQQNSVNLSLPYIQPSQAQKHVTHNEAIRLLDALVQAVVEEPPRNVPPSSAAEGARYLVGDAPSGAWAGRANAIAWRTDGAWSFLTPQIGWAVRVASDGSTRVWRSGSWQIDGLPEVVSYLGFNTSADATNRLAVSADATLLTHDGGDHRVNINKSAAAGTASVVFQVGFQGRAEMGLTGTNAYEVKVSPDGATWRTGLQVAPQTGVVSFPNGASVANRIDLGGAVPCEVGRWTAVSDGFAGAGTGAEPVLDYGQSGPLIPTGAALTDLSVAALRSDAEVTGMDLRLVFQTGPWDGTWDTNAETVRTVLHSVDNVQLGAAWGRVAADLGGWTAPDDGFLLAFLRPVGTLTATRDVACQIRVTYRTPA